MAAAPLNHLALVAGLFIAACGDAAEGPTEDDPVAAAPSPAPDTPVTSPAADGPGAAGSTPTMTMPVSPAAPADCNAPQAAAFVGEEATPPVRARLTEAVAPIAAIRWVGPGDATTEDYSPQRLNVMLDAGGVIRDVHCG